VSQHMFKLDQFCRALILFSFCRLYCQTRVQNDSDFLETVEDVWHQFRYVRMLSSDEKNWIVASHIESENVPPIGSYLIQINNKWVKDLDQEEFHQIYDVETQTYPSTRLFRKYHGTDDNLLFLSAKHNQLNLFQWLLERYDHLNVNLLNGTNESVLSVALKNGSSDAANWILSCDDLDTNTVLQVDSVCVFGRCFRIVSHICLNFSQNGDLPIHCAAQGSCHEALPIIVRQFGQKPNTPSSSGDDPLELSVKNGKDNYLTIRFLVLDSKCDLSRCVTPIGDWKDWKDNSFFIDSVICSGDLELLKELVSSILNLNILIRDATGNVNKDDLLHKASAFNNLKIIKYLIGKPLFLNPKDFNHRKMNCLHVAVENESVEAVRELVYHCDPNAPNKVCLFQYM